MKRILSAVIVIALIFALCLAPSAASHPTEAPGLAVTQLSYVDAQPQAYVGTGTYGAANKTAITVPENTYSVIIIGNGSALTLYKNVTRGLLLMSNGVVYGGAVVTFDGNTWSWYAPTAAYQMNTTNSHYRVYTHSADIMFPQF